MTDTAPLTDQQHTSHLRSRIFVILSENIPVGRVSAVTDEVIGLVQPELNRLTAEIDRLRAELAAARERLQSYGTPIKRFPPLPPEDPGYAAKRSDRALLETGISPAAWAVGKAICPEGWKCPSGVTAIFTLTKRGRLPVHGGSGSRRCPGSGQKATPLRLAEPTSAPSA